MTEEEKIQQLSIHFMEIKKDITYIQTDLSYIKDKIDKLEDVFVTRREFSPIQKLVYGLVGMVLSAVVLSLLYLVLK